MQVATNWKASAKMGDDQSILCIVAIFGEYGNFVRKIRWILYWFFWRICTRGDVNVWKVLSELVYWKVNGYIKIRKDLYDVYINKSDVSSQPV